MAVALDAKGIKIIYGNQVSSWSNNGLITVGSVVDGALLVTLAIGSGGSTSGWAATWDSGGTNQTMTKLVSLVTASDNTAVIFGLRNPTPGNKTLALSWSGTHYPSIDAISFSGVEQSSDANAFQNAITAGAGNTSITVASASGHMALALVAVTNLSAALSQTSLYFDSTSGGADSSASYAAGAGSVTFSASTASGDPAFVGIDIVAAAAATTYGYLRPKFRPLLRR